MNIHAEIKILPRSSQLRLAASILSDQRPSVQEVSTAAEVSPSSIYSWLEARRNFPNGLMAGTVKSKVLECVTANPGITSPQIAKMIGVDQGRVGSALRWLHARGHVDITARVRTGKTLVRTWAHRLTDPNLGNGGTGHGN